ncbi:MAG: cofactor-independent phosphoglycerate mutase [Oscillospiraceae bacterium]|jgi:2,3-bisphosphoglycerate-independent phosphoglycerate mutase|nr:cofactor-independent phosphoglycerate mutase [Oscillospiraceae bacterium]
MKYFMLVPDGCGDRPIPALGGRTPLEAAELTHINALAKISETGLVQTIPAGVEPGSDAANLSILGYDPAACLSGRAPLEAAAMGLPMGAADVAFRASLVTLEGDGPYETLTVRDHSAGEIGDEDAETLIRAVDNALGGPGMRFYPGVSYRCLLISDRLESGCKTTPPHDILGRPAGAYLPAGAGAGAIRALMVQSYELLKNHPLNLERIGRGLRPANSVWIWGQGRKMGLAPLERKYGVRGCMVAAVNLLKGIGRCAGMDCADVPGANGTLHTNYQGKAEAAVKAFEQGRDFVFIHVEAPDECSHTGDREGKLASLQRIDRKVFGPVTDYLKSTGEPYRVLVLPDHKTPLEIQTHSTEPVPFILYDSENPLPPDGAKAFSETCGARGRFFESGPALAAYFFR